MNSKKAIASFFLCGLLGMTATISDNLAPAIAQNTPTQSEINRDSIASQLQGFWQFLDPGYNEIGYMKLDTDGNLITIDPSGYLTLMEYRINTSTQPMQLDILNEYGLLLTIFELTPSGQFQMEIEHAEFNQFRPSEFSAEPIVFDRVPADSPIISQLEEQIDREISSQEENEAQEVAYSNLSAMSRAQQAYHLESLMFTNTLAELGVGIPSETEEYRYEIIPQLNRKTRVLMTATAKKPDLKSYTSLVYLEDFTTWTSTVYFMCETNEPSTVPPEILVDFSDAFEPVRCGEGSQQR